MLCHGFTWQVFGSRHGAICNFQLATFDADQSSDRRRKLIFECSMEQDDPFIDGTGHESCFTCPRHHMVLHHVQKFFWNLARHVATLCAHGWVRRLLSWHGPSTTYMGVTASGVSQACGSRILLDDMLHKGKFGTIPRIGSLGGDSTNLSALEAAIQYGF